MPHESKDEKGKKACAAIQDGQGASTEGGRKLRAGELVSLTPRGVACLLGTVAGGNASDGNPRCVERALRSDLEVVWDCVPWMKPWRVVPSEQRQEVAARDISLGMIISISIKPRARQRDRDIFDWESSILSWFEPWRSGADQRHLKRGIRVGVEKSVASTTKRNRLVSPNRIF